jgi:hypothetical protein
MIVEKGIFLIIIIGIAFTSDLVTIGHKKYSQKEIQHLSVNFSRISWKYWSGALLLTPLMFLTIQQGFEFAQNTPEYGSRIGYFSYALSIAYLSLYQSLFAFLTDAYPVGKWDFVIGEDNRAKRLALNGILVVFLLLSIAFVHAFYPHFIN